MKIALGTVQFGLDYGVANQVGKVQFEEALSILQFASAHSIDTIDTAIAYGESENTLGKAGVDSWKVITKLSAIPIDCGDIGDWIESQILGSLARLGISQLHGVLLHRPEQLLGKTGRQILKALQDIKKKGLAKKIGISIYVPDELETLTAAMDFDMVQAPLNILDQRLIESGWAARLKARGVELHVRSAFLQGLLLLPADQRPNRFARWQPLWAEWDRWLCENELTPLQACLGYALSVHEVEKVVVGVDSVNQLMEIIDASKNVLPNLPKWSRAIDPILINPALWSQL